MPKFIASDKLSTDKCKVKQDGHGLTLKSSLKSRQALKSSYIQHLQQDPMLGSLVDLEMALNDVPSKLNSLLAALLPGHELQEFGIFQDVSSTTSNNESDSDS